MNVSFKNLRLAGLVIWALFAREIRGKMAETGFISLFSSYIVQLVILHVIFLFINTKIVGGMNTTLFILSKYLPYYLCERLFVENANVFRENKASLGFKQVKIFHAVIAKSLSWLFYTIVVFAVLSIIVKIFVVDFEIYNWLYLFGALAIAFIGGVGLGLIASVVGVYIMQPMYFYGVFRMLYFISGIFYSIQMLPLSIQRVLLWNPFVHLVEISRHAFATGRLDDKFNFSYPTFCAVSFLCLGLVVYLSNKDIFLRKAFEV